MSVIHEKSPKHCAEKQATKLHKFNKKLVFYIVTFFLATLSLILLIWFILHPKNPHFSLKQIDINHLNTTTPFFLNSTIHLTLLSTNPNNKVGIYYDGFLIHASYKTHIITPHTPIPSFYQDQQETNILTMSLLGNHLPLDPSLSHEALHDQATGKLELDLKVTCRLRWKVGSWISRRYGFKVDCVSYVMLLGRNVSSSKQGTVCSTYI